MTPAFRLLVACCRWPDDERRVEGINAAATDFADWSGLATLADRHRVEPLVVHGLTAVGIDVPSAIAAAADNARADTLRDLGETLRIAGALEGAGIEHRILKGIPLGVAAYGSATLKRSWDIDLLVLPQDAVAAADILSRLDYRPIVPPRPLDKDEFARWSVVSKEAEFRSPRGTTVELHWRVSDHPHLLTNIDAASAVRTVAILGDRSVPTLANGLALAYLAVHGAAHSWFRLKWIADFNALLGSLDAGSRQAALNHARSHGVGNALATAIELSDQLFSDKRLSDDRLTRRLKQLCLASLAADNDRETTTLANRARWRIGTGLGYRAAELRVRLRGTLDRIDHPLPAGATWLYPWLRLPFWLHRRLKPRP